MAERVAIEVLVHRPETDEGLQKLGKQMTEVRAGYVQSVVSKLECPTAQKLELLQCLIDGFQENL